MKNAIHSTKQAEVVVPKTAATAAADSGQCIDKSFIDGPSYPTDSELTPISKQRAMDLIDEASMESFPCSDPPSYSCCHS